MTSSEVQGAKTLVGFFSDLPDRRVARTQRHSLVEVVVIAVLGVICGAEGWDELHEFGKAKAAFLSTWLELRCGIPSADTIRRIFESLGTKAFSASFERFVQALANNDAATPVGGQKHIAIDGKTLRGSLHRASKRSALHLVHAWCVDNSLLLGQLATEEKSNEITAIPALLKMLDLRNAVVTIDAMGCQKDIAADIVNAKGDYVLTLKDNHPKLRTEVEALFAADLLRKSRALADSACDTNKAHGRTETRHVRALEMPEGSAACTEWKGLKSIVCVSSVRIIGDARSEEMRYYISSLEANAEVLAAKIRRHWSVENELHWCLDVAMSEDKSRIRAGNGAQNFATLRRVALMLLKREKTVKMGIKAKQKAAGWSNDLLVRMLLGGLGDAAAT